MPPMLTLFDRKEQLVEAWHREFDDVDTVVATKTALEDLDSHDLIVSAGNSFGLMDGGLDAAIAHMIPGIQDAVQERVASYYCGEMPVGTCMIVPTSDARFPYIAYTPTMRYPRMIAAELVYDSTRAFLLAVRQWNLEHEAEPIETIACPGLGTATGGVGVFHAARVMRLAWNVVVERPPAFYLDWDEVADHLKDLYGKHT